MGVPESLSPGDIIEFPRKKGYSHFGIYKGYHKGIHWVIHRTPNQTSRLCREKAIIKEDNYYDVLGEGTAVKFKTLDEYLTPFPPNEILERAESQLGKTGYNLFTENCEHFAFGCRYGYPGSTQVEKVRRLICGREGTILLIGTVIVGALTFFLCNVVVLKILGGLASSVAGSLFAGGHLLDSCFPFAY